MKTPRSTSERLGRLVTPPQKSQSWRLPYTQASGKGPKPPGFSPCGWLRQRLPKKFHSSCRPLAEHGQPGLGDEPRSPVGRRVYDSAAPAGARAADRLRRALAADGAGGGRLALAAGFALHVGILR